MDWKLENIPAITYDEAKNRNLSKMDWESGDDMEFYVKERFKTIIKSRYKTKHGLCFVSAGSVMIGGSNPYIWVSQGWQTGAFSLLISCLIAFLFIFVAYFIVNKDRNEDIQKIENGKFLWKLDRVSGRTTDKFPKKSRIWTDSEGLSAVTLQALFWFKKGDSVFVVKEKEDSKDLIAFVI